MLSLRMQKIESAVTVGHRKAVCDFLARAVKVIFVREAA